MTVEKPEITRTYLQAVDAKTGRSRSITVYNATPEQVIEKCQKALREPAKARKRETVTA